MNNNDNILNMDSEINLICNQRDFLIKFLKRKFPKGRNEDIEDIVQSVLIKAISRASQRNQMYSVRTWLASIAVNAYFDLFRKKYNKHEVVGTSDENGIDYILENIIQDDFSETFCQDSYLSDLNKALLSGYESNINVQAFVMNFVDDIDYKEIAITQNIPVGTVKSRVFRGKTLLQKRYADLKLTYQD
jgi:RNA polymerase sigma-70 factor (ECF subfamily)